MSFMDVIEQCQCRNIRLSARGDKLAISDPDQRLDTSLTAALKQHKAAIIEWLNDSSGQLIPERPAGESWPASFAQQRLWFIDQLEGGSQQYHIPVALRFAGQLDFAAVQKAATDIVQRHQALRSVFSEVDGEARMRLAEVEQVPVQHHDLSMLDNEQQERRLRELANADLARAFDLSKDLLLRLSLVTLSSEQCALLLTVHHIAADGWSVSILVEEFAQLYAAYSRGEEATLAPLQRQYADYAWWQRQRLSGDRLQQLLGFWRQQLNDAPRLHQLPLDAPRPRRQNYRAAMFENRIDSTALAALTSIASQYQTTLFSVLQTIFAILLGRWSGVDDVVLGVPTGGRERPELERLIGFFINTLVIRTQWTAEDSFATLLARHSQRIHDVYAHQEMPFELLVQELNPERDLAYNPLCQVKFVLQNYEEKELGIDQVDIQTINLNYQSIRFDLDLTVYQGEGGLYLAWSYKQDLFAAATIERLAESFVCLVQEVIKNPQRRLRELPLTSTESLQQTRQLGRGRRREPQPQDDVLRAFLEQVKQQPAAPALSDGDGARLSYTELQQRADRLAGFLRDQDLGDEACIGLLLNRSAALIVAILGIWRAGYAYVPMEPGNTAQRNGAIIDNADIEVVLTEAALVERLPVAGIDLFMLDGCADQPDWLQEYADADSELAACGERHALAYVIYTSGSTGTPKGVAISHASLADYLGFAVEHYYHQSLAGSTVVTSHGFDITVPALLLPLMQGGEVHLLAAEEVLTAFADRLGDIDCPPQLLRLTPNHAQALCWQLETTAPLSAAHHFILGGEALPVALAHQLARQFPQARLFNHYGPTEATVGCVIHEIDPALPLPEPVPIGRAMANVELRVLDGEGYEVPAGVIGELYIGGPSLAAGYLKQADLTAAAFVELPAEQGGAQRFYRSGDLVRWSANNELQYLGRADQQVKRRGYRIEPGEIATHLKAHPDVSDAVVTARGTGSDLQLIAYVVNNKTPAALADQLSHWLRGRLADFLLPDHIVILQALPLTASGKLDRAALPAPQGGKRQQSAPLSGEQEMAMAAIWRRVLDREAIGAEDNFFDLGGHSLLAMRVISEIAKHYGQRLMVRDLFEHPTIRQLAALIRPREASVEAIEPAARDGDLPLSFAQRRLWVIDQLEGGSRQYNMPLALRLDGEFSVTAFQQALDRLVARHEVLRTAIVSVAGEGRQRIHPPLTVPIQQLDLSALDQQAQDRRVAETARDEALQPFDLSQPLKLRCRVLMLNEQSRVVLFTMHHIASDGWSVAVMTREFGALYQSLCADQSAELPALPIQYADYACWQQDKLQGAALDGPLAYWRRQLADLPTVHSLPLDYPRPARQNYIAGRFARLLDKATLEQLQQLARNYELSLFMLLETAFAVLISRWSNNTDIAIGVPVAGRWHKDLEPLIGFFINTLVLRTQVHDNPPFSDLLMTMREQILDAYAYQQVPFELLVDELAGERNLAFNPLVQIKFTLQNLQEETLHVGDNQFSLIDSGVEFIRFDLDLTATERDDGLLCDWSYKEALFSKASIEAMADSFCTLLRAIAADPQQSVQSLNLVDEPALARLENLGQGRARAIAGADDFLTALRDQAAQRPDALAVTDASGQRLSYRQLLILADRLALMLQDQGLAPGEWVGLALSRSVKLLIAITAVWRSGACYVPLEPSNTLARNQAVISDADIELVLSDASMVATLPVAGIDLLLLDDCLDDAEWLQEYTDDSGTLIERSAAEASAYLIYTSGSTGLPKGVEITHANLADYLGFSGESYYSAEVDGALVVTSHGFDITVPSLLLPLMHGDTVRLLPAEDPLPALQQWLVEPDCGAWLMRMTPNHVRALLLLMQEQEGLPQAHRFVIGGEALRSDLAAQLRQLFPHSRIYNHYGPTEATVGCSLYPLADIAEDKPQQSLVPIGRPQANVILRVLDANRQLMPPGAPGELYIGGPGVARGYHKRPELNAQRFIELTTATGKQRFYRSGDQVRWLADGQLIYLDRIDHQIKLRGYRIEPGEIEQLLLAQSAVDQAAVIKVVVNSNESLAAYVVASQPAAELHDKILNQLRDVLPAYMVPQHLMFLERLPVGANGKLDRNALPLPEAAATASYQPPRNQREQLLATIWADVLGMERIGISDNFFALGGDSILAIQMVAKAAQAGLRCSARQLFEHQTIASLAPHCATMEDSPPAPQYPSRGDQRLLPAQIRFFNSDAVDLHHYNQSLLLELPAALARSDLEAVVTALYQRHDALRLRFHQGASNPACSWQARYHDFVPGMAAASVIDETLSGADWAAQLTTRCNHWQASLDLAAGPLLRMVQLQVDDAASSGTAYLLIVLHHLVVDGVSWRILLDDLHLATRQQLAGEQPRLAAKTASVQQWAEAVHDYAPSQELAAEKPFWLQQMQLPAAALPYDSDAAAAPHHSSAYHHLQLDAQRTSEWLQGCNQPYRTQAQELLLAALYLALRQWTGNPEQRLELEGHGRQLTLDSLDLSSTLGWFTCHYPLVLSADDKATGAVIKAIKEQFRQLPQHGAGYGLLTQVAADADLQAAEAEQPHSVLFNYLGQLDRAGGANAGDRAGDSAGGSSAIRLSNHDAGAAISPQRQRSHALVIKAVVISGELQLTLDYSERQFKAQTIAAFAQLLSDALEQVIEHCLSPQAGGLTPSDFPLAECDQQQLEQWQERYPAIEDLYNATPMQQGMLFHNLLQRSAYVMQTELDIYGVLDSDVLRRAWQWVVARHPALRTAFVGQEHHWQQLVLRQAELPWYEDDWRHWSRDQQHQQYTEFRAADRAAGFELAQPPLMRVALIRLDDQHYRLLWTHHHLLSDGWSTPLVYADVLSAYQSYSEGQAPAAQPVADYRDYLRWLQSQSLDEARAHWRQLLAAQQAPTALTVDRLPVADDSGYREQQLTLDPVATEALKQLAREQGTTVNTLLQLAWGWLLRCYSGEQQVVFGITTAGRPPQVAGIENMVGLFINTLPVRIDFARSSQLKDLLTLLHNEVQTSLDYAYLPLPEIQSCSGVAAGSPLFESLLVFENYPLEPVTQARRGGSRSTIRVEARPGMIDTHYKLSLAAFLDQQLQLRCGFRAEQFEAATVARMLGHLQQILQQLPTLEVVTELQLLTAAERRQLADWNATAQAYPQAATIEQRVRLWAQRQPQALAVHYEGTELSYAELDAQAARLAALLVEQGVSAGDFVGLCLERSQAMMVAMLAVLKTGAAYLPLDPEYPAERLQYMIEDSGCRLVLTQDHLCRRLPDRGVRLFPIDLTGWIRRWRDGEGKAIEAVTVEAAAPAYLIYTSGSSGQPKGVVLHHRGALNLAANQQRLLKVDTASRVLHFASLSFDAATWDWMMALYAGASLHICTQQTRLDPQRLGAYLQQQRITHATLPPSLLAYLPLHDNYALQRLIIAGEACDPGLARRWAEHYCLINAYGPTETTVCATLGEVPVSGTITIGHPLGNATAHVIGVDNQPLPVGLIGELCVGGDGLATGYHGQPQLTAERFVNLASVGQRVYRTGDLVQRLSDGSLKFIGRIDHQVKIRGHRVEPGEVERQLALLPGVREAAVVVIDDQDGRPALAAYAAVDDDSQAEYQPVALRQALAERLPDYLLPATLQLVPKLPLTANGKLDREALPAVDFTAASSAYVGPQTPTEEALCVIWARLLKLQADQISTAAHFFELGGHSLLVVKLQTALKAEFGFEIALEKLFNRQTLSQLAEMLDSLALLAAGDDDAVDDDEAADEDDMIERIF